MSRAVVPVGRPSHPPDVEEGWWRSVLPGNRLAVKYSDDKVLHERVVGWTSPRVGWSSSLPTETSGKKTCQGRILIAGPYVVVSCLTKEKVVSG